MALLDHTIGHADAVISDILANLNEWSMVSIGRLLRWTGSVFLVLDDAFKAALLSQLVPLKPASPQPAHLVERLLASR